MFDIEIDTLLVRIYANFHCIVNASLTEKKQVMKVVEGRIFDVAIPFHRY